jgi:cytochrome c oxidase subunit 2
MIDRLGPNPPRKVLIASANLLFARGLENILRQQENGQDVEILHTRSLPGTIEELENWNPDVVIVDYDDQTINRSEFLRYFVSGERPMQVMLVSLAANGTIVVYDRRTINPDQFDDWLNLSKHAVE